MAPCGCEHSKHGRRGSQGRWQTLTSCIVGPQIGQVLKLVRKHCARLCRRPAACDVDEVVCMRTAPVRSPCHVYRTSCTRTEKGKFMASCPSPCCRRN